MRYIEDIFQDRTCYNFSNKDIDDGLLQKIYDLMKLGPTSGNSCPLRIIFVKTAANKEKLLNCVMEGNIAKVKSAPVIALFAYDIKFFNKMDKINPVSPDLQKYFSSSAEVALDTAYRNSTLQAAYFMIIARSFGLDCGPMSGFDVNAIESNFLQDDFKINFICNLGYKAEDNPYNRLPRLSFDECCKII